MATTVAFVVCLVALAGQRLFELRESRAHEVDIRRRGGRESAPGHFVVMQLLHVSWFVAMLLEVLVLEAPFHLPLALAALAVVSLGQALRLAARRALGPRWSVRIYTLPGEPVVTSGIYRYLSHPNYLGVTLEIAAVPLLHGAWRTALIWSVANAALLWWRIRQEERALRRDSLFESRLGTQPRFLPFGWLRALRLRGRARMP